MFRWNHVAIKKLKHFCVSAEAFEEFVKEITTLEKCHRDQIVFYGPCTLPDQLILVTEFAP